MSFGSRRQRRQAPENPFEAVGFENWYEPIPGATLDLEFFLVDFKTQIFREPVEEEGDRYDDPEMDEGDEGRPQRAPRYQEVSAVVLFFLVEDPHQDGVYLKRKALFRQYPYFCLLLDETANPNYIAQLIRDEYERDVVRVEPIEAYDAADLLFLKKKTFLKVEVTVPNKVPQLRDRLTNYPGVQEWREADIQYHHRVAIDQKLNLGKWYRATASNQAIGSIVESPRTDTPPLKLVAYDIETDNDRKRQPNPHVDNITMVAVYEGTDLGLDNRVIVNAEAIDCSNVTDFWILIRKADDTHSMPWVDWAPLSTEGLDSNESILDKRPMRAHVVPDEKTLILTFLEYLEGIRPDIIADFYGDKFDMPFLKVRADKHGINFSGRTGFQFMAKVDRRVIEDWMQDVENVASYGVFHLDAFLWNFKYSYLPKKDLGLKPSVARKLKIMPIGRESLWQLSDEEEEGEGNPAEAVGYAGSDGYVTWRYVKEIILDFAISMGRMFSVNSSEVLTKTAGALDDLLVDSIGHHRGIIAKQKFKQSGIGYFTDKINIQGVTYTGGFVTAPHPGIWRRDILYDFPRDPRRYQDLRQVLETILPDVERKTLERTKKSFFDSNIRQHFASDDDYFEYELRSNYNNCVSVASEFLPGKGQTVEEEFSRADQLEVIKADQRREELFVEIETLTELEGRSNLKGIHLDVTSMYPSQIRQYKLQPSGIVNPKTCLSCPQRASGGTPEQPVCGFDSPWTGKINARKPCVHKSKDNKMDNGYCQLFQRPCDFPYSEEDMCPKYDMGSEKNLSGQEFYTRGSDGQILVYVLKGLTFSRIPLEESYLGRGYRRDQQTSEFVANHLNQWVEENIEGAQVNFEGDYPFRVEGLLPRPILWRGFLYIDIRQKHTTFLIALRSRFCQKAYDYMSAIMDMFFQERVNHKREGKRLWGIIADKKKRGEVVPADLVQRQKFHDSTQLGLKVPLNSIYGLLGMKGGVHNASLPSAGVTTSLSARLIQWSADVLGGFGPITEVDTDGIWFFIPDALPTHFKLEIGFPKDGEETEVVTGATIPILEEYLNDRVVEAKSNPYYWSNDGSSIRHEPKSLLGFEQDGPYDFQYVQGKKKYIVYNRRANGSWEEEELTGLETKRADFSRLHKELQVTILDTFLEDWGQTDLESLFRKAVAKVDEYIAKIRAGELDNDYFVMPKTIKKRPEEYASQGPEVMSALLMRDLGYTIEPGMRVDYYQIKPIKDPKLKAELKVAPIQLFNLPYKEVTKFLKKRGIAKLSFTLGSIRSMEDIRKQILRIDYDEYIQSLVGANKITERMIYSVARRQGVLLMGDKRKSKTLRLGGGVRSPKPPMIKEPTKAEQEEQATPPTSPGTITDLPLTEELANPVPVLRQTVAQVQKLPPSKKRNGLNSFLTEGGEGAISAFAEEANVRISRLLPILARFQNCPNTPHYYCGYCGQSWQDHDCVGQQLCPNCREEVHFELT